MAKKKNLPMAASASMPAQAQPQQAQLAISGTDLSITLTLCDDGMWRYLLFFGQQPAGEGIMSDEGYTAVEAAEKIATLINARQLAARFGRML